MISKEFWEVEGLRFTFFYSNNRSESLGLNWQKVFGEPPESRTDRPAQRVTIEEGKWNELNFSIVSYPDRVDIVAKGSADTPAFPVFGGFESSIELFQTAIVNVGLEQISRVAFGAILLHMESSVEDSYRTLGQYLPHISIGADSREFFYQINKPFDSNIVGLEGFKFNSLRRWAAVSIQQINIEADKVVAKAEYATRLELDVNSNSEFDLTSRDGLARQALDAVLSNAVSVARGKLNA